MISLSEPDAKLVANVLEDSIQEIAEGIRREPAPNGQRRLESIVTKLRAERDTERDGLVKPPPAVDDVFPGEATRGAGMRLS